MLQYLRVQNSIMTAPISLLCLLLVFQRSLAYNPRTNNHTALKFNFLPLQSEKVWGPFIRGNNASCAKTYQAYLEAWQAQDWHAAADGAYDTSNCILESADEMKKKTSDSAAILLGLAPILFSSLGPSLTEIGLISMRRPFLALLLSMGTAAVFPWRVLQYTEDDYAENTLMRQIGMDKSVGKSVSFWLAGKGGQSSTSTRRRSSPLFFAIGIVEYLLIAAAAFNLIYTSSQLGVAAVYIPDSPTSFFPVIWILSPLLIHFCTSGAILVNQWLRSKSRRQAIKASYEITPTNALQGSKYKAQNTHRLANLILGDNQEVAGWIPRIISWCEIQFLPSFAHPPIPSAYIKPTKAMVLIHNFATALAFAQVVFGVTVFSSLLFVSLVDAAVILLRYLASVFVCRLILAFELGGMRSSKNQ